MYERFNYRARRVMQLANQEAQRFHHEYIGTGDILLGLMREDTGLTSAVFQNLGFGKTPSRSPQTIVRLEVEKLVQSGSDMVTTDKLPQTPQAKKVIEYSMEEARNLNRNCVDIEHILLGLLREEGVVAQVLINVGLKLEDVREEVLKLRGYGVEGDSRKDCLAEMKTLVIIKPDAVRRCLVGEIISRFEKKRFTIIALRVHHLTVEDAEKLYAEHKGKSFYGELIKFTAMDPVVVMILYRADAIKGARKLIGALESFKDAPGTIRGDYADIDPHNIVHASDSHESFLEETKIFF